MAVADLTRFQEILASVKGNILIVLPDNPSVDAVASGLALSLALEKKGFSTTVSAPSPMTVEFNRLVGVDKIRNDLGDKNLILSFANYQADKIEKVSYNIENGLFSLTVVPKPGNLAPGKENIQLNYAGMGGDLVIVVDAAYPEGLGAFAQNKEFVENIPSLNLTLLGNTPVSGWPKSIELIDASGVSISETVFQIIEALGVLVDEDLATNLFIGLEAGSNNFSASWIKPETFTLAADLIRAGARRAPKVQAQAFGQNVPKFAPENKPRQTMPEDVSAFRDAGNLG